jgi:hypothetical protein
MVLFIFIFLNYIYYNVYLEAPGRLERPAPRRSVHRGRDHDVSCVDAVVVRLILVLPWDEDNRQDSLCVALCDTK